MFITLFHNHTNDHLERILNLQCSLPFLIYGVTSIPYFYSFKVGWSTEWVHRDSWYAFCLTMSFCYLHKYFPKSKILKSSFLPQNSKSFNRNVPSFWHLVLGNRNLWGCYWFYFLVATFPLQLACLWNLSNIPEIQKYHEIVSMCVNMLIFPVLGRFFIQLRL